MDKTFYVGKVNPITYFKLKEFEGRSCYVFPVVMMVEGVHHGANTDAPLYYSTEELSRFADVWNTKPVVLGHPFSHDENSYISACSVSVLTEYKIGEIMNARVEGEKLKAEAWLDVDLLNDRAPEILQKIRWGETLEVSIGCFLKKDPEHGAWRDEEYAYVARDIVPDHLAILLDVEGACSVADGAGLPRVNSKHKDDSMADKDAGAMKLEINVAPLEAILEGFISRMDDLHAKMSVNEAVKDTDPNPEPDDKDADAGADETAPLDGVNENTDKETSEDSPMTIQEFVASASPEIQSVLNEGLAMLEQRKSDLVEKVLANSKEVFTKDELAGMTVNELQKLEKLVLVNLPADEPATDYSVNGAKTEGITANSAETKAYIPEAWNV